MSALLEVLAISLTTAYLAYRIQLQVRDNEDEREAVAWFAALRRAAIHDQAGQAETEGQQ